MADCEGERQLTLAYLAYVDDMVSDYDRLWAEEKQALWPIWFDPEITPEQLEELLCREWQVVDFDMIDWTVPIAENPAIRSSGRMTLAIKLASKGQFRGRVGDLRETLDSILEE